jgi:chaperone modulatory protein CbpM
MIDPRLPIEAALDEVWLDLDDLCRMARLTPDWVRERIAGGLLPTAHGAHDDWRFDALALRRAQRLVALERDFDAVPELAALVADLEDEIARLRRRLGRQLNRC